MNYQEDHLNYFKTKRDQYTVEIRKSKTTQILAEKRSKLTNELCNRTNEIIENPQQSFSEVLEKLGQAVALFEQSYKAEDYDHLAQNVGQIKNLISDKEKPPISDLLGTGIVPFIVHLLDPSLFKFENLIMECCWTVSFIADGGVEFTEYLLTLDILPKLVKVLEHPNFEARNNAIWAILTIVTGLPEHKVVVMPREVMEKIAILLSNRNCQQKIAKNVLQLIFGLIKRRAEYHQLVQFLPILQTVAANSKNEMCLYLIANIFSYLAAMTTNIDYFKEVFTPENIQHVVSLLSKKFLSRNQAVKVLCTLLTNGVDQAQFLINQGVIQALAPLLGDTKPAVRKGVVMAFSIILSYGYNYIEKLLNYKDKEILRNLFYLVNTDSNEEVVQECVNCFAYICWEGNIKHAELLVEAEVIEILIRNLLQYKSSKLIQACLKALQSIFEKAKVAYNIADSSQNPYVIRFEQSNGLEAIYGLQTHPEDVISGITAKLIEDHLNHE